MKVPNPWYSPGHGQGPSGEYEETPNTVRKLTSVDEPTPNPVDVVPIGESLPPENDPQV